MPTSPWERPIEQLVFLDIETDGLLAELTRVHCIGVIRGDSTESLLTTKDQMELFLQSLMYDKQLLVIGHNIIKFDIPALQKIFPWFNLPLDRVFDTFVASCLAFSDPDSRRRIPPDFPGRCYNKHSLEAWGHRLGVLKGDYGKTTDWATYSEEMGEYCLQDVRVTRELYSRLTRNDWLAPLALELEQQVASIIGRQERFGVWFDKSKALKLYADLCVAKQEVLAELRLLFPAWLSKDKEYMPKVNRNGFTKGCPVSRLKWVEFNPNSTAHIVYWLKKRHGWEPTEFTEKGNVKMDEDVLSDIDLPEARAIQKYQLVEKRISQLMTGEQAWLTKVTPEGKIHGSVSSCGAGTRRMTHFGPNLAQVPANRAPYGERCRELFGPPEGWLMVGADAEQLELRGVAHLLFPFDKGTYVRAAIDGKKEDGTEIHSINARAFGTDRDTGKTIYYAMSYGAGFEKLGRIKTKSWNKTENVKIGRKLKNNFLRNMIAFEKLLESLKSQAKKQGFLTDLDGQRFRIRSDHSVLNEINQRLGAIIMKRAQVILDESLQALGLVPGESYEFMLTVHDEWQFAARTQEIAEVIAREAADSIRKAGEHYRLSCPLAGNAVVGNNWKETH